MRRVSFVAIHIALILTACALALAWAWSYSRAGTAGFGHIESVGEGAVMCKWVIESRDGGVSLWRRRDSAIDPNLVEDWRSRPGWGAGWSFAPNNSREYPFSRIPAGLMARIGFQLNDVSWTAPPVAACRLTSVTFPYWFAIGVVVLSPLIAATRAARRGRRIRRGECVHCGYDLRGSGGRCPECGAPSMDYEPAADELRSITNGDRPTNTKETGGFL